LDNLGSYRVCHGFILTKQDDYFSFDFDHFCIEHHFRGCWGSSEGWVDWEGYQLELCQKSDMYYLNGNLFTGGLDGPGAADEQDLDGKSA